MTRVIVSPLKAWTWTPRRRAIAEYIGLGITTAVWAVAQPLGWHVPTLLILVAAWVAYFILRVWREPALIREWGVLPREWGRALRLHATASLIALGVVLALGLLQNTFAIPRHFWFILIAYPVWAWCQQFLLQNAVVANAARLGLPRSVLPLAGGTAFAFAHLPDLPLAGLTLMGGTLWTWIFLRAPNLWLLALSHTIVGTLAFVWVLGRDPLLEFPQVLEWLG